MNRCVKNRFRKGSVLSHILPILVWIVALGCLVVMLRFRSERFELVGYAQVAEHQLAATCDGRIEQLPVELFQNVTEGQTLAVINTVLENEDIHSELKVITAEIEHLMAQLVPTQENLLTQASQRLSDRQAAQRRLSIDVENARLQLLQLKTVIETDKITLQDLGIEVKIAQNLFDQDAIAQYQLDKAKVQYETLDKKIQSSQQELAQTQTDLDNAQVRLDNFVSQGATGGQSIDSALVVIHKEIKVQQARLEQVLARRMPLQLKAPYDGVISLLLSASGEVVLANQPILKIAHTQPKQIVAYAPQNCVGDIKERMTVEIVKTSVPQRISRSQITYLGPNVEMLPERLWRNPNLPQWGRPMLINVPPGLKLLPGESVGIRGI